MKLNARQRRLVLVAIGYAIRWEETLSEAWGGDAPEAKDCRKLIGRFRRLAKTVRESGRKATTPAPAGKE